MRVVGEGYFREGRGGCGAKEEGGADTYCIRSQVT